MKFYAGCDMNALQNKYSYYLAIQIGGAFDLNFADIELCHDKVKSKNEPIML